MAIKAMPLLALHWNVEDATDRHHTGGHFLTAPRFFSESLRMPWTFTLTQQEEVATDTWVEA